MCKRENRRELPRWATVAISAGMLVHSVCLVASWINKTNGRTKAISRRRRWRQNYRVFDADLRGERELPHKLVESLISQWRERKRNSPFRKQFKKGTSFTHCRNSVNAVVTGFGFIDLSIIGFGFTLTVTLNIDVSSNRRYKQMIQFTLCYCCSKVWILLLMLFFLNKSVFYLFLSITG